MCPEVRQPYKVHWPREACLKAKRPLDFPHSGLWFLGSSPTLFLHWNLLETPFYFFGLAPIGGHSYLLGSCFEVHHHWGYGLRPYFGGVWSFSSLPTPVNWVYRSPTQSHFRKRLAKLLGLKTPIVDVLTRYGSSLGGNIPFDFLLCRFGKPKCLATYRGDFVDFEEHWTFYRC